MENLLSSVSGALFFLLLWCSQTSSSYIRDQNSCGKLKCDAPRNFKFLPGLKYMYQYDAKVNTVFDVERYNSSTLEIKALFELHFSTPCHGELVVTSVTMTDTTEIDKEDSGTNTMDSFSEHILRFYFHNGVFREICPEKDEPVWVLNFKKGILSAFQNSMQRLDLDEHVIEIDINGECQTDFSLEEVNGTMLIISKKKRLSSCTSRHRLHSIIPTASYVFQTKYHKWSPMASNFSCRQYVDHNIIIMVGCTESHSFLPFYNQTLGASTSTSFNITLIEEEEEESYSKDYSRINSKKVERRTSLLYDTQMYLKQSSESLQETTKLVILMCNLNTEELQPEFSEVFNKFIHIARYLPYESISELYNNSGSLCDSGKKHVLDGLPHLRSSASIEVMKDIILTEELPPPTVSQFLFAMSLFNRPEADTIRAVVPLVLDKPPDIQTYFAISTLLHSFCKQKPSCESDNHVQIIVSQMELRIHQQIFPEDQLETVIGTLKALGNAGVLTPTLLKSLQKIIKRQDLAVELRIAAIDAHRRLPCDVSKAFLMKVYQNQTNEEEIRIKAYLEIIKCPSHQDLEAIKETLAKEQNNQVGSFVWSQLHNLKVSALPSQMEIQAMLQNTDFSSKFNKAYFKFSRNYESSVYINEYGVGGFVVSNVLFSHKSYIPRSISSNITVILFGEAVNIAEITLDLEGFEQYVEALFWRNGLLSKFEKSIKAYRVLRSTASTIKSKIDALPNVIAGSFSVPKASLSVKIFGNDVQYSRVTGKENINKLLSNLNPIKIIKDFLSGQEIKIEKSMLVCDARYVTPLAVGLPLNTDAIITSTVKFDLAGYINSSGFVSEGQFDLEGKLRPSVAVNMVGSMGVDAYFWKTEVKVVSKVYTSTAIAGTLKLRSYNFAFISLNLPLKKSQIFSGNNTLVVLQGGKEIPLQGLTAGRVETKICSWPILDDAFGLTFCLKSLLPKSQLVLDSPLVIFNGPLDIEVTLDKSDPSTQLYTLEFNSTDLEDKRVISIVFDTPGSTVKRGLTATLNLDKEGPNVTLVFQTTRTQLKAQGFYRNTPEEISLKFQLDMNGKKHIDLQIALFIKASKYGSTYEPVILFQINNKRVAELAGKYQWVEKNELSQCEVALYFRTNRFSTAVSGYVRVNKVSLSTNIKLDYQLDNAKQEYVRLEILSADRSTKQKSQFFGNVTLLSSAYPQINTILHINYQKGQGHLDCKATIKTNPHLRDDTHKLVIRTGFTYFRTYNGSKSDLLIEIKKADDDIDLKFSMAAFLSSGAVSLSSIVRYSKGKEITLFFDAKFPKGSSLLIESNIRVTIPNTAEAMTVHTLLQENKPLKYDINFLAIWFSGHNITINGFYEDESTFSDSVHILKLLSQSQIFQIIEFFGRLHLSDKEYRTNLTIDHNSKRYGLALHHETQNPYVMVSNGVLIFNMSTYTLSNEIDLIQRQASIELHLDQYRDVYIKLRGPRSANEIKALLDIKWDANRDPSQKFVFTFEGVKLNCTNYEASSSIEYPGRIIKGYMYIAHKDLDYIGILDLRWSATSIISMAANLKMDLQNSGTMEIAATVFTPFENWKASHLKYGLWMLENSLRSAGNVTWGQNGSAMMNVTYDSLTSDSQVGFSVTTFLNTSIKEVSPLRGEISYSQSSQHIDAVFDLESSSIHRVRLESSGRILQDRFFTDYSGHIKVKTPFHNLTKGELSGAFNIDVNNSFSGSSIVALNERNVTLSFDGSAQTINESKLVLTVFTPFQRYQKIVGKFLFSSSKAQIVAELKATAFTLGFRTIYLFKSIQDFDLQLSAVTGVNFVSSVLLVGTLNNETVDFRGGWNSVMVGVTARSHYEDWHDFEYRGTLFMPFESFRESGAVAKFMVKDKFHMEVAAAVAKAKVGLKVVSVLNPEDEFGTDENEFTNVKNSSVLWQAVFELDTLYYPTATGHFKVLNFNHVFYLAIANLQLNVVNITVNDHLTFKNNFAITNNLLITSSHPLLSETKSKFELKGVWPARVITELDLKATSNNRTYKFDMEGQYSYHPVGNSDNEGIYSINYRLTTPFEALDHCYFDFNLQAEKYFFSSNMTIDVVDNRINMYGTLEVDDRYFSLSTDFSVASPSLSLAFCHFTFTKDLSQVEKSVTVILKYPSKRGDAENFEVATSWHFGGEQYVKLSGNIVTPYEKLSNLQADFLFSSDVKNKEYNLEILFKQSHFSELRMSGKIVKEKLNVRIESSFEHFREIIVNGTLKQQADKSLLLNSAFSTDEKVSLDLEIKSTTGVPLDMNLRILDYRHSEQGQELVNAVVDLRRKRVHGDVGYDLLTIIQSGDLNIHLASDITSKPTEENWSFVATSNHSEYKEVGLRIVVIPGNNEIFEVSINGHTDTSILKSNFNIICNMWFEGKKGRVKAKLDSWPLAGDSYLEWEWDYLRNMKGLVNASYIFHNATRDFSSFLFLRSPSASMDNVCLGTDISLNNKMWWFKTNATLMAPSTRNIAFTSFLLLPHNVKETHQLVGKLYYASNYKYINQVLKYSTVYSQMGLQTSVQMKMFDGAIEGSLFLEGGVNGVHFLKDNFSATIKDKQCDIESVFTSSFTSEDISVSMHYLKPETIHKITVDVQSPGHAVIILATVDFETINNMYANINCTTPISKFPHIGMLLQAITNETLYYRYGVLLWPNNSALFNYTHTQSLLEELGSSINDGIFLVDFPLATRHTIKLHYSYQEKNKLSSGHSKLLYNNDTVLQGNFSREQLLSELEKDDLIKVLVTNVYMPLGLNYQHKLKKDAVNPADFYTDKKRVEVFKAENPLFSLAGEIIMEKTALDNLIDLNLMYSNRSLKLRTGFCTNNTLYSTAHVVLKPSVWASSKFYLYRNHSEQESHEELDFGLSYPRRNMQLSGAYTWALNTLDCHLRLEPGSQSQPVSAALAWNASNTLHQQVFLLLSHPSFEKNVTLLAHISQNKNTIVNVDADLEYAVLSKRKFSFSGNLTSKLKNNEKMYELAISAKHPIIRFQMDVSGALKKKPGFMFAFKNFSYTRSFLPLQFWNSSLKLDLNDKDIEVQRQSLRDFAYIRTKYYNKLAKHYLEGNVIKGKTTNVSGAGFLDLVNLKSEATVNLTTEFMSGSWHETLAVKRFKMMFKSVHAFSILNPVEFLYTLYCNPQWKLYVLLKDASQQILVRGDYVDNRHVFWKLWRRYDDLTENDIAFDVRLNHSRLLTASYTWRTSMKQDLIEAFHASCSYVWTYMTETADFWTDFMKTEISDTVNEVWLDAGPALQEFIDDVTNVEQLKADIVYFQAAFNESYDANEFFMQDIYNITLLLAEEIAFRDKMGDLPKIVSELWQVMGETGESIRQSILYLIDTVKNLYIKAVSVFTELLQGDALQNISQLIGRLSSKYDKMIKDLHVTFIHYVESLWVQMAVTFTDAWKRTLQVIEPAFIEFVHYVEAVTWDLSKTFIEFLYQKQSLILTSANLAKDSNLTKDMDKFYKDITKNGIFDSFKKYTAMIFGMVKEKYFKVVPFGYELTEITSEIYQDVKELYKLPAVNFTFEATIALQEKAVWFYTYFNVGKKVQQALPFVYRKLIDLSHNALQNEVINHARKTKFVFESRRGQLYLEQLLPMPWHSLNRVPNFEEIREYKMLTDAQKWLTPSNRTLWSLYYEYSPLLEYRNWLPPYKGEAIIGKNHHYVTFDKQHYSFRSPCSYLLAKDFVRNDFTLILKYANGKHTIGLFIGPYTVEIDLDGDTVSIPSHSNAKIPTDLNGTLVLFEFGVVKIESDMGFAIECNVKYDICLIKLSGWYFGKTAGLLGTMDNEPSNDMMMPSGRVTTDQIVFTHSWMLDSGSEKCTSHLPAQRKQLNTALLTTCDSFFASKASQFSSCFPVVNPNAYNHLCQESLRDVDNDICTSAIMYVQECLARNIPLRIPNICVKCKLYSNVPMLEGDFSQMRGEAVPQSSDVVFLLEAGKCNQFSLHRKSMPTVVNAVSKELIDAGLSNNRFTVVVFGGEGVFDQPRSLMAGNEVFSSDKHITQLFSQLPIGSGSGDILRALSYAIKLKFRAGVSKTFILIPCSSCDSNSTSFDFSALHEVFIEKDIKLHIIMSNDFGLEKIRSNKILYGVDSVTAYTKNDFKKLKGDKDLRRQVKQAKHLLGYCSHLALESNGTVFSSSKLDTMNVNVAKKFMGVFAKRVASSAKPSHCQNCECAADENGIDSIECVLCEYPTPNFDDFEFKDNSSLTRSFEDPTDFDYYGNDNL